MKVILIQNIPNLGKKGEVKEVKSGYWRNFLNPQKLAILATPQALKKLKEEQLKKEEEKRLKETEIKKALETIKEKLIEIKAKSDEKGNLFAGITNRLISQELNKQYKVKIEPNFLLLEKPLKKIGEYKIPIKNGGELKIKISPEN